MQVGFERSEIQYNSSSTEIARPYPWNSNIDMTGTPLNAANSTEDKREDERKDRHKDEKNKGTAETCEGKIQGEEKTRIEWAGLGKREDRKESDPPALTIRVL